MIFHRTDVPGAYVIELEKIRDDRGSFARSWCREEFAAAGLGGEVLQCSVSFNHKKGTLRGMHYQAPPFAESKLVRCTRGAILDVLIDLRPGSPTFLKWFSDVLTPDNDKMFFIPKGCAHGFQTLENGSEVNYQISEFYDPRSARGVRWDDPLFSIRWPLAVSMISEKDRTYPNASAAMFQELSEIWKSSKK